MLFCLATFPGLTWAANMVAVPSGQEHCATAKKDGAYCYDWQLTADPSIHIVSVGYEDGGTVTVYRLDTGGSYEKIARVYPVLRELGDNNLLYWGYSWDIKDVAVSVDEGTVKFFGAFRHGFIEDSNTAPLGRKTPVPILLFIGNTTQPSINSPRVPLQKVSLAELQANEHDQLPHDPESAIRTWLLHPHR